jgi:CheY-like chemotaxis protein
MSAARDRAATILVVEDNPANQMLIEAVLQAAGFAVTVVNSADEAALSLARQRPDLILMDVQLPGKDGISFTRQLKADPELLSIPIVAVTAYAMSTERQEILDAGCAGYIAKPFDTRTLADDVRVFLPQGSAGDRAQLR